jgi:hypothetical protein
MLLHLLALSLQKKDSNAGDVNVAGIKGRSETPIQQN